MSIDPFGAIRAPVSLSLPDHGGGALANLTFAAKDNFAVAGERSSAGNPDWLRTHAAEPHTAPAVQAILEAGATLVAKTNMDELAFSLDGVNTHYGTPINPRAPERIPGGSSSGSASAVAGKLVDFALGTDTAGSVRVPSSLCGLFGMRPTHGRISIEGIVPFAPSFDTVGWMARTGELLYRVGEVLLPREGETSATLRRLLIAADLFAAADEPVRHVLQPLLPKVARALGRIETLSAVGDLESWSAIFGTLRGAEVRTSLGDWIAATQPNFGPGIRERFEQTTAITAEMVEQAKTERQEIRRQLDGLLGSDGVLCLPTVPVLASRRSASAADLGIYRARALSMTITATIGGLPQVTLPLTEVEGIPVGLSLIGPRGSDRCLLGLAEPVAHLVCST